VKTAKGETLDLISEHGGSPIVIRVAVLSNSLSLAENKTMLF